MDALLEEELLPEDEALEEEELLGNDTDLEDDDLLGVLTLLEELSRVREETDELLPEGICPVLLFTLSLEGEFLKLSEPVSTFELRLSTF